MPHNQITLVEPRTFKELAALDTSRVADLALRKGFTPEIKGINEKDRTIDFVISTDHVDRDSDTINVNGWDLSDYNKNPVVLFGHDYGKPPVARAIRTRVSDGKLKSTAQFADRETYEFADTVFRLLMGGYLNAVSVGFTPLEWSFTEDDDRSFGVDFKRQKLLEYSVVPVPANPNALIEARSKGINIQPVVDWADNILHNSKEVRQGLFIPKNTLEQIRSSGTKSAPVISLPPKKETVMDEKQLKDLLAGLAGVTEQLKRFADAQETAAKANKDLDVKALVKAAVEAALKEQSEKAASEQATKDALKKAVEDAVAEIIKGETGKIS